ncbi:MAG: substrate-binding domain-containing protein [Kiritimatiellae bacterium]|nr:substrate-binding domain-containing protein [Kiritimatiellia bacterium]
MTILLFLSNTDFPVHWLMRGVSQKAAALGWSLQTSEFREGPDGRYRLIRSPGGADLRGVLDFWRPDGCIVECSGSPKLLGPSDFPGIPAVFVDRHPADVPEGTMCVYSDPAPIARAAARELMLLGNDHYAYVPCPGDDVWSRDRGEEFRHLVRRTGKTVHSLPAELAASDAPHFARTLEKWIGRLPRPCGVFVANDLAAESVLLACSAMGLSVPEDIAVVGVDNAEYLCENTHPTLSSVERDLFGAGRIAAEMLDDALRHGRPAPSRPFGITGLVRRASSRRVRTGDVRLARALEFIRRRACEGVSPPDVAAEMGVCRTLADRLFRKNLGHTILDEIHEVRLEHAKALLHRHVGTSAVADMCGYRSVSDFRRVFRARVGISVKAFPSS